MKKIIALLLCVLMVCGLFAGCSKGATDEEKIVGSWTAKVDIAKAMNAIFEVQDPDMAETMALKDVVVTIVWEFTEDGEYSMKVDKKASADAMDDLVAQIETGMPKYLEKTLGMSIEEFEELSGMKIEDLIAEAFGDDPAGMLMESFEDLEGQYKLDDGKLYISDDPDNEPGKDDYYTYEFKGDDEMTLDVGKFEDEDKQEMEELMFPMELEKD